MTVPPMQWGYPRTVEGFFHALSRGQYENVQGLDIFSNPGRFGFQLWYIVTGLAESFSWVYLFVGVLPFLFLLKMRRREKSWIIGVTCIYFCLAVLLGILLNVSPDRSSSDLNKVFYTASHGLFALMIGYGLTLLAAYVATHYANFRRWGIVGSVVAIVLALYCLKDATGKLFFGPAGDISLFKLPHYIALAFAPGQYGLPVFANLILLAIPVLLLGALLVYRHRGPVLILLCLFTAMPLWSGLSHWYNSEQRNHWFGYWFGHDMFTPPFQDNGRLSYDNARRAALLKDPKNARLIYPEMTRNTILFGGTDPGRFCPTYAIFCDSFIPHRCQPEQDQKFDRRDVYLITQNALADGTYLDYLRSQYNRSKQIDPPFFSELSKYFFTLFLGPDNADTGLTGFVNNTLFNVLDRPFTAWGAYVEKRRRAEGVYPTSEIYIPSPEDSQRSFEEYARQKQLTTTDGRIQISGQVDVMNINGLLCKVIFDNNPTNEFYVEESFPLDWMYPYETPFGIIMKINRNLQPELSQDVFDLDHKFWTDFSPRLCGNWITYDTTVQQIADFVERTYIQNNYQGYTGDHAFVRDNDAQKAFSKLRSSQAGMYAWRCFPHSPQNPVGCPPEFVQKSAASQAALIRETDFAFKQAFAFCPYSPEAVYRYVNFLMQRAQAAEMSGQMDQAVRHFDDAILIAKTCKKLDPYNDSITGLIKTVQDYKQQFTGHAQAVNQIDQLENTARTNPGDIHNLITLGGTYMQMQQTNRAEELFSQALDTPGLKFNEAAAIAQYFNFIGNYPKLETALEKLAALAPGQPEPLYDLAALQTVLGSNTEAMKNLKQALDWSNQRRKLNPQASDLTASNRTDRRFDRLRPLPEFQKLLAPN
jgi:tetratricopeptide (TPR) repeat protein